MRLDSCTVGDLQENSGDAESQYREGRLAIKSISKREAVMWNSGF